MIRVVGRKKGTEDTIYRGVCGKCGAIIEATKDELHVGFSKTMYLELCPNCFNKWVKMREKVSVGKLFGLIK